ncbi:MAG: FAD-dependent oxidoreductase [Clostridia bacterium]|nr:FAD-dependent oxidoreductase [Clostridia bacterium]
MDTILYTKQLPIKKSYDVIVAGGGVAGCAAAVSIAKRGKSVLLLEKTNLLGGLGTIGLINFFVPMCNGRGKQIIFGFADKWLRKSAELSYDTIPNDWKNGEPKQPTEQRLMQVYSPNIFALQLLEEVKNAGADILFDCIGVEAVCEKNVVKGVITDSKSGLEFYGCKFLVDTTGDADLLRRMDIPVQKGENYFTYSAKMLTLGGMQRALEKQDVHHAISTFFGGAINLWGDHQPDNVPKWSGLTVEEVTDYLTTNQLLVLKKLKAIPKNERDIVTLPTMPQFRTTCRLQGDYALKVADVYRHFDDSICAINDFEHRDHLWEVPYRCLIKTGYPNVITAGRSASGEGYGWDLLRVIPPTILTGQAAGEACCIAIDDQVGMDNVNVQKLQTVLEKENVMIHFPDEYVPEDKTIILHGKNAADVGHF